MIPLVLASAFLVASHLVPSTPSVRQRLLHLLGQRPFYLCYGTISATALAALIWAYHRAGPGDWLYGPFEGARWLAVAAMPVAIFLILGRLLTPVTGHRLRGVYRITTVPGSLGTLIWSLLHLINVGEDRTVIVFSSMAIIATGATIKNARLASLWWPSGSAIPFLSILDGRTPWRELDISWAHLLLTVVTYLGLLLLHPLVIGIDPLAGYFSW